MAPVTLSDVIFSEQANHNFSQILGDLKKCNLSITNRLTSVLQDAAFVGAVGDALQLPLVANERCGSWYVDPARKAASAYFKSTDGHAGQWQLSTRRLNLHLLELIGKHDGCIIVDSTRRGKRIPDALSKTVPIWCFIMNRVLFPDDPACHQLYVPPSAVSDSEKSQIESRLATFLDRFEQLGIDAAPLRRCVSKPLRPIWVAQDGHPVEPLSAAFAQFHSVVCCTASRRVAGTEMSEGGYIQGAGDDTEAWACGLTAPIFWRHRDDLLSTSEADLPGLIASLLASAGPSGLYTTGIRQVTPRISVGTLPAELASLEPYSCLIAVHSTKTPFETWAKSRRHMEVGLGTGKIGSRMMRDALPRICNFAEEYVHSRVMSGLELKIVVACLSGKDLSVGLALALDCWLFNDDGSTRPSSDERSFDKTIIRARLGRIMQAVPESNPSRATLQSVNSFLMDWRK